jgi:hypothetical protein
VNWHASVYRDLERLSSIDSPESRSLIAVYALDSEFHNGGLIQYLMNNAADTWCDLREAFRIFDCASGIAWMNDVERRYGGPLPIDRDARMLAISEMPGYLQDKDPFEEEHLALESGLIGEVQRIGSELWKSFG